MSKYIATVIKTGNSYALRVPIEYVAEAQLTLGQKVRLDEPSVVSKGQDRKKIQGVIKKLQEVGAYKNIKDPVIWQREIRKDRPIPGRDQ